MEFADILSSLRRRWKLSVGILLLTGAVLAAFLVTREETEPAPRWRAETDLLVPARDEDGNMPEGVPARLVFGQAEIATSEEVRRAALAEADVPDAEARRLGFGYSQNESGDIITLTVEGRDPVVARVVADAWTDEYIEARRQTVRDLNADELERTRRSLDVHTSRLAGVVSEISAIDPLLLDVIPRGASTDEEGEPIASNVPYDIPIDTALLVFERAELEARIDAARRAYATQTTAAAGNFATVAEIPPVRNITPPVDSPSTPTALILGIGLLLALVLPVLIDRMDHTIRDAKTARAAFSAPVLASIPAVSRARRDEIAAPGSPREAAFRALAATAVATDRLPRSIVVTSALGDEQDAVAANFAAALAGLGVRVVLIGTTPRQRWFAAPALAATEVGRANGNGHRNGNGKRAADREEPGPEGAPAALAGNGSPTHDAQATTDSPHGATTFPELLDLAYEGRLNGGAPDHLQRTHLENLFVLPPGLTDIDVSNDGLAPLLQALASEGIDVTVLAASALLEDPNTTIYAWTTRSVLWVVETGEITVEEARDAASRLTLAGVTPFGVAMVDQES